MFDFDQFPSLSEKLTGGYRDRFEAALIALAKAQDNKFIIKADYTRITDPVNRALETAWGQTINKHHSFTREDRGDVFKGVPFTDAEQKLDLWYYHPTIANSTGKSKKVAALKDETPLKAALTGFFAEFAELIKEIIALKQFVGKKPPKVDPILAYQAPHQDQKALRAIYDLLMEITDAASYQSLVAMFRKSTTELVARYEVARQAKIAISTFCEIKDERGRRVGENTENRFTLEDVFDRISNLPKEPATPEMIEKVAIQYADYARRSFVVRNMLKITPIVEAKGNFSEAELIDLRQNMIDGSVRVSFADGAWFVAATSLRHNISKLGTPYLQYPLTFSYGKTSKGEDFAAASEEWMNETFAAGA